MKTKTPLFDERLDIILSNLIRHKRNCLWKGKHLHCDGEFQVLLEDIEFLKMLRVPPPNYCPTCRRIRRFVHMNQLRLFKRPCNAPEHVESVISILPEECPFPVYDFMYYISDEFDALLFSREYKRDVDPLVQLFDLRKIAPMPSFLNRDPSSINSEYSNGGRNLKNGYYCMGCYSSENIWYSGLANESREIMDSGLVRHSEFVYRSILVEHVYKSSFIYFSNDCSDSMFLFDCKNCDSCFGCVNLRNAKYCVWNKQLSKGEYNAFIKSAYPLRRDSLLLYRKKFWNLVKSLPANASRNTSVENVSGTMLRNTRNAYDVTDADKAEHIRYSDGCLSHQDSMDVLFSGGKSSLLYGVVNIGSHSSNVKFSVSSKFATNSEFIFNCKNVDNCFMCFGLKDKSYCLLNKQYLPEEYFKLVDKIKCKLLENGEYGDGIGMEFSAQAYNFSMGQIYYPLNTNEVQSLGGYIAKEPNTNMGNSKLLLSKDVPQTIDEVTDDIVNYAIKCEVTGKPFRIVPSELQFYRTMKLPLPVTHPIVRMEERLLLAPFGKKYTTNCQNCQKEIYSIFDPGDKFTLYCEKCYQTEVY